MVKIDEKINIEQSSITAEDEKASIDVFHYL